MEERDVQEGHGDGAEPVALNADENEATSIGEIIASLVAELGADRAWIWNDEVRFGSRASGRPGSLSVVRPETVGFADDHAGDPLNSASVQPQSARPHLAQRGM